MCDMDESVCTYEYKFVHSGCVSVWLQRVWGGGWGVVAAAAEPIRIRGLLLAESPGRCVIYKEAAVVLCL